MTTARIEKIKNGFLAYDDLTCEEYFFKTLDEAIKRVKEVFEEILAK